MDAEPLTKRERREREYLDLVAEGWHDVTIATVMNVSWQTVIGYRSSIKRKRRAAGLSDQPAPPVECRLRS
jgi:FixJ family two-component response regulator